MEILNILDDHSRYLIAAVATIRVTGALVVTTFQEAFGHCGIPASVLTDNGMVFTTRFAGGRRGRHSKNGLETLLAEHRVEQKNSSPNHPQTCGKVCEDLDLTIGLEPGVELVHPGAVHPVPRRCLTINDRAVRTRRALETGQRPPPHAVSYVLRHVSPMA